MTVSALHIWTMTSEYGINSSLHPQSRSLNGPTLPWGQAVLVSLTIVLLSDLFSGDVEGVGELLKLDVQADDHQDDDDQQPDFHEGEKHALFLGGDGPESRT